MEAKVVLANDRASVLHRSVDHLAATEDQRGVLQVAIRSECLDGCYFLRNMVYREHEVSALDYGFGSDRVMPLNQVQRRASLLDRE
jgi:hypothetical protein